MMIGRVVAGSELMAPCEIIGRQAMASRRMPSYEITRAGESETAKAIVHLAIFGLAVTAGLYNLVTLQARPARHLAVNVIVYAALTYHEALQVLGHLRR